MADLNYIINFASNTLGLDRATSAVGKLGAVVAAVGIGVAAVKLKNFFSDAIDGAAEFEQQLATVQAVSGSTVEQMGRIKEASIELGKSTRYNATEAAEGFEILARAGLNTEQALETIPSVLALAQGNALGLAEAAGFVTKAVQGMGLEFSESGRVADVLAKAAASANTDVSGLGAALSYAAPTANSLGLTLEETAAYIGKFADAGVDASRAGTAFNGILSQFGNSASLFKRELANINITTDDFNLAVRQLAASGDKGKKAINALGLEAGPAFKALLAQGMGSLDELTEKLNDAGGTAAKQAETMNNTWQGALAGLDSAWSTLKDTLGESFLDSMTNSFKDLAAEIVSLVDSGKIKEFGENVATEFKKASAFVIEFVQNIDMAAVLDKVSSSFETLQTVMQGLNGGFQALNIAFQSLKSGVLAIGVAVSMVITIFADLWKMTIDGGSAFARFFGITTEGMDKFSAGLGDALKASEDFRNFATDEIAQAGESIGNSFDSIAGKAGDVGEDVLTSAEKIRLGFEQIVDEAFQGSLEVGQAIDDIRKSISFMAEEFDNPEQFAALIDTIVRTGNEAVVGADLLFKLGVAAADGTEEAQKAVDKATVAVEGLGNAAEKEADAIKTAIDGTFSALKIDVQQNLSGVNTATQQTFDLIANGAKSVSESTYSATEKVQLLSALFAEGLNAAKTKEEFEALNEVTKHYGLSSVATAEQQKILQAGMRGGAEAAKIASDAIDKQNESLAANDVAISTNTQNTKENTEAKKESAIAAWNNSFAIDAANQSESASLAFMQQATASIKNKITALEKLSGTSGQADIAFNRLMESMGYVDGYRWSGMQDFANAMNRVNDVVDKQVSSFEKAKDRANEMTKALGGSTVSSRDLADAQAALRKATDANVQGLIRMDSQTLSGLQNAIDSARQRMQGLSDDATRTAENLEAALAKLQGNEDKARSIEQSRKLLELEEKIAEAKTSGNNEAEAQLKRALDLQKQINREEDKKARAQQAEQTQRQQEQVAKQAPTSTNNNQSNAPSRTIDVNFNVGGKSVNATIPEAQQSTFEQMMRELQESKAIAGY